MLCELQLTKRHIDGAQHMGATEGTQAAISGAVTGVVDLAGFDVARRERSSPAAYLAAAATGGALGRLSYWHRNPLGRLISVDVYDPKAIALAQRIGGRPSVRFSSDKLGREFDAVSDEFVGQTKPPNFKLGSDFRAQAKATFEAALSTRRTPYFHFEGPPSPDVLRKLDEYSRRYGIKPVIDTVPF